MFAIKNMAIRKNLPKREKKVPNGTANDAQPTGEPSVQPSAEMTQVTPSPEVTTPQSAPPDLQASQGGSPNEAANPPSQSTLPSKYASAKVRKKKFPLAQKILIAGIILSAALLAYSLFFSSSNPPPGSETGAKKSTENSKAQKPAAETSNLPQIAKKEPNHPAAPAAVEVNQQPQNAIQQPIVRTEASTQAEGQTSESTPQNEPVSLHLIDNYFAEKDYVRAYNACSKLSQNLTGKEFDLMRDFLRLRMATCLMQKSATDKAVEMFRSVCESPSVAVKVLANYDLCLLEMNSGHYLKARTRAYKTITLTGAIASDYKWALTIERDCQFLAAEAIARQTLSLSDADKVFPKQLWYHSEENDPLTGLDEVELQKVLNAGIERFNNGLLAPQIQALESGAGSQISASWSVVCNGPPIEELMARFASNAGIDIKWSKRTDDSIASTQQPAGWNRAVVLYLPVATTQQVLSTAAGSVGLLALFNDTNTVTITDPGEYYTLSEHTRMLNDYSIWLWRKLLLMYSDDRRIANAHFMLGILHQQKGQVSNAISEYKLVASRYSRTAFAPYALLRSSELKSDLRDYQGATRDLKQLIDQYQENELIGQAYLNLAETTMKAGDYEQACSLYRRAHNLGVTNEARAGGALGAGKCFYQMKEYETALKWLTMYLDTINIPQAKGQKPAKQDLKNNPDLYTAYLIMGKIHLALGDLKHACEMLERTVQRADTSDEYAVAIETLVEAQMKQGDLVTALQTIENVRPWSFSQEHTTRMLVLKGSILRESGLTEQAISLLNDRIQYLTSTRLKADVTIELARCEIAVNHPDMARAYLSDAISTIEPGPVAQSASLELAEVCLKLTDYKQTISICNQLLDSSPSAEIKQRASKLLSAAYSSQKNYDKAALALLAPADRHNKEKKTTETSEK